MIVIHATFPIDPEKRDEAVDLIEDLVAQSNREDGVVEYHATTDISDPSLFRFIERYEDEAAFEAHGDSEHFAEFEAALPDLLADEPEVTRFDGATATDVEV